MATYTGTTSGTRASFGAVSAHASGMLESCVPNASGAPRSESTDDGGDAIAHAAATAAVPPQASRLARQVGAVAGSTSTHRGMGAPTGHSSPRTGLHSVPPPLTLDLLMSPIRSILHQINTATSRRLPMLQLGRASGVASDTLQPAWEYCNSQSILILDGASFPRAPGKSITRVRAYQVLELRMMDLLDAEVIAPSINLQTDAVTLCQRVLDTQGTESRRAHPLTVQPDLLLFAEQYGAAFPSSIFLGGYIMLSSPASGDTDADSKLSDQMDAYLRSLQVGDPMPVNSSTKLANDAVVNVHICGAMMAHSATPETVGAWLHELVQNPTCTVPILSSSKESHKKAPSIRADAGDTVRTCAGSSRMHFQPLDPDAGMITCLDLMEYIPSLKMSACVPAAVAATPSVFAKAPLTLYSAARMLQSMIDEPAVGAVTYSLRDNTHRRDCDTYGMVVAYTVPAWGSFPKVIVRALATRRESICIPGNAREISVTFRYRTLLGLGPWAMIHEPTPPHQDTKVLPVEYSYDSVGTTARAFAVHGKWLSMEVIQTEPLEESRTLTYRSSLFPKHQTTARETNKTSSSAASAVPLASHVLLAPHSDWTAARPRSGDFVTGRAAHRVPPSAPMEEPTHEVEMVRHDAPTRYCGTSVLTGDVTDDRDADEGLPPATNERKI